MRSAIAILATALFSIYTRGAYAQSMSIYKHSLSNDKNINNNLPVCYDRDLLAAISDTMFNEGNPRYIWIDLIIDGYITEGTTYRNLSVIITLNSHIENEKFPIPANVQTAYVNKFKSFIEHLEEPVSKYDFYSFRSFFSINPQDIFNSESHFRKDTKSELHGLGLTTKGELRFLNELVKDGLAPLNTALKLEFSSKGFYIHGQRMPAGLREKYMSICQEEFGNNYYNDGSSFSRAPLDENTLDKEIKALEDRISGIKTNTTE